MFKMINRSKKAVSPVIAVVLLIALTVAAAAVIWAITSGYLSGGSASLNVKTNNGGSIDSTGKNLTITLVLDASETISLTKASLSGNNLAIPNDTGVVPSADLDSGDNSVTITFTTTGTWATGSYNLAISWNADGGSNKILSLSINAS